MSASFLLALAMGWLSQAHRAMVVGQGLGNFLSLGNFILKCITLNVMLWLARDNVILWARWILQTNGQQLYKKV